MKILDKLKNALFEEEYVEVEEKPIKKKPIKEVKPPKKERSRDIEEKPIAKKIVLPERNEVKITTHEDMDEIEQKVEEIRKEKSFPIISDNEFINEHNDFAEIEEEKEEEKIVEKEFTPKVERLREEKYEEVIPKPQPRPKHEEKHHKLYGMDEMPIKEPEYGTYEKEDRTFFKPSPIISPIYGILDKNYKKDEIVPKREVRLTSTYARGTIDVDTVRKKAYGNLSDDIDSTVALGTLDGNLMDQEVVDLREDETPEIKKVTIEDAEEYFNDLGLEYNVDYKDIQKEQPIKTNNEEDVIEKSEEIAPVVDKEEYEARIRQEQENDNIDDDDNLFDLIDSMYEKE